MTRFDRSRYRRHGWRSAPPATGPPVSIVAAGSRAAQDRRAAGPLPSAAVADPDPAAALLGRPLADKGRPLVQGGHLEPRRQRPEAPDPAEG